MQSSISIYISQTPHRLHIYHKDNDWLLIEKPIGLLADLHPWYPELNSIADNLRIQKEKWSFPIAKSIYALDPEIYGAIGIALTPASNEWFRNALGSDTFTFYFHFLTLSTLSLSEKVCTLPIATHSKEPKAIISQKTGKKASTSFRFIDQYGPYQLWEARTHYPRLHQIRIHAEATGFQIPGETLYSNTPLPLLSSLKKNYKSKQEEKPLYISLAMQLYGIEYVKDNSKLPIHHHIGYTKNFGAMLKQLRSYSL